MIDIERRQLALEVAKHIVAMFRSDEPSDYCLSEVADVVLEASELMLASTESDGKR